MTKRGYSKEAPFFVKFKNMKSELLLLSLFALALIWIIWRWIKGNLRHLSEQDIEDFLTNRMGRKELKHTREHLLQCNECKKLLDDISKEPQKHKPDRLLKRRFE